MHSQTQYIYFFYLSDLAVSLFWSTYRM